jgi:hypothetical protein
LLASLLASGISHIDSLPLKIGTPLSIEIPAPVSTTTCSFGLAVKPNFCTMPTYFTMLSARLSSDVPYRHDEFLGNAVRFVVSSS